MPINNLADASPDKVLAQRENVTYTERKRKLVLNSLVLHGGRPYVDTRLTRFPGESSIDWEGTLADVSKTKWKDATPKIEGRRYRAYLVNNAARVAEKIRQYVFAKPPQRDNENTDMQADITRQGESLNAFMGNVLKNIVATKWCWIGIDAPRVEGQLSRAEASDNKIRPYWRLYPAQEVVDWHFDDKGELVWLMTQTEKWDNSDPEVFNKVECVRRLWEKGSVTEYVITKSTGTDAKIDSEKTITLEGMDFVPFVLAGELSEKPHWYDDVEDLQRASLDLESSIDTLMFKTVFAQMVLPASLADEATSDSGGVGIAKTVEAIVGLSNAILEHPDDKGITRYIGPDADALKAMQDELGRKREELFDVVGLHLNFTKNFSESADSKHFDHLDPQAVLRNYAQQIAEAEHKAWVLTNKWDSSVAVPVPTYSDTFRVSNIYEDFKSLVLAENMDLPDSVKRLNLHGVVDTLLEITNIQLTDEQQATINKDIEEMDFSEPIMLDASSMAGKVNNGVVDQATDDGEGIRAQAEGN